MLLKVFELRPGVGSTFNGYEDHLGTLGNNYTFIIGTKDKPTERQRERIERAIAGAWEGIFGDPQRELRRFFGRAIFAPAYGLTIIRDSTAPTGESALTSFVYNGFFIVFALLESESAVSEEEEQEVTREITRAIENQVREMTHKPRIGVVTLYNCSVQLLEGQDYRMG